MSKKSQFKKSVKTAIAAAALTAALSSCEMFKGKHSCGSKNGCKSSKKEAKAKCSSHSCSSKEKASCSSKEKASCSSKAKCSSSKK